MLFVFVMIYSIIKLINNVNLLNIVIINDWIVLNWLLLLLY